jgi:DJ-1 family protein
VLIPIAQGTEEMEVVIIIDILRRAKLLVKVAGENEIVTCAHGLKIIPDKLIDNIDDDEFYDALIIPGGLEGVNNLRNNEYFIDILKRHNRKEIFIGAICAAPLILSSAKILKSNHKITSHPSIREQLSSFEITEDAVVIDENIITSKGAGTALEFSLKIVELLINLETAQNISKSICFTSNE